LETLQREAGVALPDDLQTLLRWHNGQNTETIAGAFEQGFFLMGTDQIVEVKKDLDAHAPTGWQKAWLPFLDDDHENYVCVDTTQPAAPVKEVWRGRTDSPSAAPSLKAWVQHFVDGLEKGAYKEDPERGTFQRT
jgi:cell wall assembly regulator SMI1